MLCNFILNRYYDTAASTFQTAPPNPVNDFEVQMYVMVSLCIV